jgi:hypothetical protein
MRADETGAACNQHLFLGLRVDGIHALDSFGFKERG